MKAPPPVRKLRPEVPEAMAAVLARMMAKDPAGRYQTPAEAVAVLAPWTRTPCRRRRRPRCRRCGRRPRRPTLAEHARFGRVHRRESREPRNGLARTGRRAGLRQPVAPSRPVVPGPEPLSAPCRPPPFLHPLRSLTRTIGRTCSTTPPMLPFRASAKGRRSGERLDFRLRTYRWHFVGALLPGAAGRRRLAGSRLGRGASIPSAPAPADAAPRRSRPRASRQPAGDRPGRPRSS